MAQAYLIDEYGDYSMSDRAELVITHTEIYQTEHEEETASALEVLFSTTGLPKLGQTNMVDGRTVYCKSVSPRRKVSPDDKRNLWIFTAVWTNHDPPIDSSGQPATKPTEIAKKVEFFYEQDYGPVHDATFLGFADGRSVPSWLSGYQGPVVNSALTPTDVQRERTVEHILVTQYVTQWDSLQAYHNKVNSDAITISDGHGVSESYGAKELRIDMVSMGATFFLEGVRYYERRIELTVNRNTWVHYEKDEGTACLMWNGKTYGPDGNLWTKDDIAQYIGLPTNGTVPDHYWRTLWIYDQLGNHSNIEHPVPFNGSGVPVPWKDHNGVPSSSQAVLMYDVYPAVPFAGLGL